MNVRTLSSATPLRDTLFADPALGAYAVIDAAARIGFVEALRDAGADPLCLFIGALEREVAAVAPWLAPLAPGAPALDVLEAGRGRAEAVYLLSPLGASAVRRHLRTLTRVRMPDGEVVFFRFYDPRVLRSVAPLFDEGQRRAFFGKVAAAWLCEGPQGEVLRFEPGADATIVAAS